MAENQVAINEFKENTLTYNGKKIWMNLNLLFQAEPSKN